MEYTEALALVKSEFNTRYDAAHCEIIRTGCTYDGCNGFCVVLYNYGDKIMVSDMSITREIFSEVADEEWESLCRENGFEFNKWRIEKKFNGIEDVYDFINFLDMISDKYFQLN